MTAPDQRAIAPDEPGFVSKLLASWNRKNMIFERTTYSLCTPYSIYTRMVVNRLKLTRALLRLQQGPTGLRTSSKRERSQLQALLELYVLMTEWVMEFVQPSREQNVVVFTRMNLMSVSSSSRARRGSGPCSRNLVDTR